MDIATINVRNLVLYKKHINIKHTEQKFKICNKDFKTSIDLISHVAKEHHKDEEAWDIQCQSTPKSHEDEQNSSMENDAMLDEFL